MPGDLHGQLGVTPPAWMRKAPPSEKCSMPAGDSGCELGVTRSPLMRDGKGSIFVTVGTTSFDALIAAVDSEPFARLLVDKGYGTLVVQYGELRSSL